MPLKRRDFSKYLVHLTRDLGGSPARDNLLSILSSQTLEARSPFGIALARLEKHDCATAEALESQCACCFSETPLDDLGGLIDPGVWRQYSFQPYGIVFERAQLLLEGANPVWYLNSYSGPGVDFPWLAHNVNGLIAQAAVGETPEARAKTFLASDISRLTPFFEVIGSWPTKWGVKTKDFSFEREWRHRGDLTFRVADVVAVITPPDEQHRLRSDFTSITGRDTLEDTAWRELEPQEVLGNGT